MGQAAHTECRLTCCQHTEHTAASCPVLPSGKEEVSTGRGILWVFINRELFYIVKVFSTSPFRQNSGLHC